MDSAGSPQLVLIDTSSLLPLVYCGHGRMVRLIEAKYALQFGIVQAVKSEAQNRLSPPSKFAGRQEALRKAVENKTLVIVDGAYLKSRFESVGESLFRRCDEEGESLYYLGLDRGEAYTYGASLILKCPVVNDDNTALRRLRRDRTDVPTPHLRLWDIILFGLQAGLLTQRDCEGTRTSLLKLKEGMPACFLAKSVSVGLSCFYCRLVDPTRPSIGAERTQAPFDECGRLEVRPVP